MPVQPGKEESNMLDHFRGYAKRVSLAAAATLLAAAPALLAQSSSSDRWLHVRVVSTDAKGETVRVNIPLDLAEKVLPTINKDRLHNGKVKIDDTRIDNGDVDLHALIDAIRTSKDGEFVTVQSTENDVRVAKQGGQLIVHVTDRSGHGIHHHHAKHNDADKSEDQKDDDKDSAKANTNKEQQVEVKIPMKVIDALFSAGKDELDLVAALRALSTQGDTELVSVKDQENTVRIWLDSKNVAN
jgi:hypothetical protein